MTSRTALQVAEAFFANIRDRDAAAVAELLDDDANIWIIGQFPFSGNRTKSDLVAAVEMLINAMKGAPVIDILDTVCEDGRVSVRGRGNMTTVDGEPYCNDYHIFMDTKDGKIVRYAEYFDTELVSRVLMKA